MKEYKVVVAHPNQQHSFKLAIALNKMNVLYQYNTTLYIKRNSLLGKIMQKLSFIKTFRNLIISCNQEIVGFVRTYSVFWGILFYFISKVDKSKKLVYYIYEVMTKKFGRKVAKKVLDNQIDLIVMYDFTATECFTILNKCKSDIIKVLDMSSIPAIEISKILKQEEDAGFGENYTLLKKRYTEDRCKYFGKEIEMADYFLVASEYCKQSLLKYGVQAEQVFSAPYGMENLEFFRNEPNKSKNRIVSFVFVGRLEGTKGFFYLMDAMQKIWETRQDFSLTLVGAHCGNLNVLNKYSKFYNYIGKVQRKELIKIYNESNVYILPSLWEGFSFSLLEAMSCSLPVIATECSVALDVVRQGEEGFVIKSRSIGELEEAITWYIEHQEEIPLMGEKAKKAIEKYTWENYNKSINDIFTTILEKEQMELKQ